MKSVLVLLAAHVFSLVSAQAGEVVFVSYNIENYLLHRHESGGPKPPVEIAAVVRIVKEINPDILGVCEMGEREDFEDFKTRLKDAGLGYTDFEYVDSTDSERHLALLSRFPIEAHQSIPNVSYAIAGRLEKVKRGFLDVTIRVGEQELRVVGVHLKSKRDVAENEAVVRREEAHLLRQHLDEIMVQNDRVKLLAYGDFNDLKNEPAIQEIVGLRTSPRHMTDLAPKDSIGDRWTEFWKAADLYSRIDYIFVNHALLSEVIQAKCSVYRSDDWNEASDHRAVIATLRLGK